MIFLSFLYKQQTAIIAIALLGLVSVYSYTAGTRLERSKWQEKENARLTETAIIILKNQKDNTAKERKTSNAHQIELSAIRNTYELNNKRLRFKTAQCNTASLSNPSVGTNADTTGTIELPDEITKNLRRLARDADEVTAVARGLQELYR